MPKYELVGLREETPQEAALYDWFSKQATASPDRLEEAGRQIIGLVTALLGVLFGVVALTGETLPAYLQLLVVRALSIGAVGLWLVALLAALWVVLPWRWAVNPARPAAQAQVFATLLRHKSNALTVSVATFGVGVLMLGMVLIIALWRA